MPLSRTSVSTPVVSAGFEASEDKAVDCSRGYTDRSIAVQVLVETGSSDSNAELVPDTLPASFERKLPLLSSLPDRDIGRAPELYQATSYPLAVCSAPISVQPGN